jgi:hypothetical protein
VLIGGKPVAFSLQSNPALYISIPAKLSYGSASTLMLQFSSDVSDL